MKYPNLASRVLALCCERLTAVWEPIYGHPVLVVESFVDSQLFRGTCDKTLVLRGKHKAQHTIERVVYVCSLEQAPLTRHRTLGAHPSLLGHRSRPAPTTRCQPLFLQMKRSLIL